MCPDDGGSTLDDFIQYVRNKTRWDQKSRTLIFPFKKILFDFFIKLSQMCRNGLFDEYQEIKSQAPDGTFDNARLAQNQAKVGLQHHPWHLHRHATIIVIIIAPPSSFSFSSLSSRNLNSSNWWGFNHHSNTTNLKPSDMSTLVCREVRGVSVWRSVYSNVVLRSSPIWMKTCGRLLFGRNLCGSSLRGRSRRCGWRCFLEKQSIWLGGRERGTGWSDNLDLFGDTR